MAEESAFNDRCFSHSHQVHTWLKSWKRNKTKNLEIKVRKGNNLQSTMMSNHFYQHIYLIAKCNERSSTKSVRVWENCKVQKNCFQCLTILYWMHRLYHHTVSITCMQMRMKWTFCIALFIYYFSHAYYNMKLFTNRVIWFILCCDINTKYICLYIERDRYV